MWRYRSCQPHVTADDAAAPNRRRPAKNGCAGVDDDIVFNRGMTFHPANKPPLIVHHEAKGAEGYPLIYFDVVPNNCRLANNYARSMIDKEPAADCGARMNINPCNG